MGKVAQKTAVVYCRTSSSGQKEARTIKAQETVCRKLVASYDVKVIAYGPEKDGWLKDDGISGTLLEGRALAKLIDDIRQKRVAIDFLVSPEMSRIVRQDRSSTDPVKREQSARDAATINTVLDFAGVRIIDEKGIKEPGSVLSTIEQSIASEEHRHMLRRTKNGKAETLSTGGWATGGRVPWGYVREKRANMRGTIPVRDPETAPMLVQLLRWYAEGGASFAAKKATDAGWPTPRSGQSFKKKEAPKWYPTSVLQIVSRLDEYRGGEKTLTIGDVTGVVKFPPLVDAGLYRDVKLRLKERSKQRRTTLLSSFFTDCACGDHVRGSSSMKTGRFYLRCKNGCGGVREDILTPKLWELTIARLIQIREHESIHTNGKDPYGPQLEAARARLKSIEVKMDKLLDLNLDGTIDKETFSRRSESLRAEKLQAKGDVDRFEREREAHAQKKHGIETVHSRVQAMLKSIKGGLSIEAKREILRKLLQGDRVVLTYPKKGKKALPTITLPAFGDLPPVTVKMDKDVTEQLHGVSRDVLDRYYDVNDSVEEVALG